MKKIVIVAGTNRSGSRSSFVASCIHKIYEELGANPELLDLANLPVDIFRPDIYENKPPSLQPWLESVLSSNGLVVVVPEYNGSFPGALKYFIDLLPFPESFEHKPVCFVGIASGGWGALRAVEHLQGVFGYRYAHIFPRRVFLPQISHSIDENGSLKPDLFARLKDQAQGFLEFIQKIQS
ncbi:MAG: NAD(P)H-dependent oxidoreductase [Chthoniobacterales bacterium]|nr:NAD(P)H-dependent oxidoreductase [Chthoniobacterales bacterium]